MKKIIAIAAIIASAQASAFWGWDNSNNAPDGRYNGKGDFIGNATGEAEATFSMTFTGKGKTRGDFKGNGDSNSNWAGYGYDAPYYYGYTPYAASVTPVTAPAQPAAQ